MPEINLNVLWNIANIVYIQTNYITENMHTISLRI